MKKRVALTKQSKNISRGVTTTATGNMMREDGSLKGPGMPQLKEDFQWAIQNRDTMTYRRSRLNFESRYCVWPGQSDDGRKWRARKDDDQVFPWPGASDARVPLVDMYIRKDVQFLNVLTARMRPTVSPTETNDAKFANTATTFLRWMRFQQMTEMRTENRLLANYLCERGAGVMHVFWDRRSQLGYEEMDMEQLITRIQGELQSNPQADPRLQQLPDMLLNPAYDDEAAAIAQDFYPDVSATVLKKAIEDMRRDGSAKFPRPYMVVNRPRVMALAVNEDVFLPPDMTSLEDTRAVHRRELVTETKLRDRIKTCDWDPKWVQRVIDTQRGVITYGDEYMTLRNRYGGRQCQNYERMFEVLHSYRRLTDENGVPAIFYTCWSAGIADDWAYHDLLGYDHGEMPFVLAEREKRSRRVDDSRGYGEIGSTWQNQIKAEWDGRIDRASIATLPPSYHPPGEAPDRWGPGVQVPTNRPTSYGFMEAPENDTGTLEVEQSVRGFADEYFGRSKREEDLAENKMAQQDLADTWLEAQRKMDSQTFGLCQQYMPDQFWYRVTGDQKGRTLHATREEIQGKFDVAVSLDIGDLDPSKAQEKLQSLETLLNMDVNGRIDRDEALTVAAELLDPNLGERLLKPGEEASLAEVEDEKRIFSQLMSAVMVDIKPGQAYGLRMKVMQQLMQQNQMAQQLYQANPQVKEAFEARGKQLQLQVDQQQNAVIGRGGPNFAPKTLADG